MDHWDDPVSNRIEEKHLEPLLDAVKVAICAMETMGESVVRSRNECS